MIQFKDEKELSKYLAKAIITKEQGGLYNKIILKHPDGWSVTYPEINTDIEQNAGENQIEGGAVSISSSAKVYTCKDCLRHKFCYLAEKRKDKACTKISLCKEAEKQYRPFKDCNELIEHYQKKYKSAVGCDIYFPSLYKPCIWIRDITEDAKGDIELITGFTEHGNVLINGTSYPLQHLFQMYEFLDGTPVGVEE